MAKFRKVVFHEIPVDPRFYQKSGLEVKKVISENLDFGGVMAVCDGSGYCGGWGTDFGPYKSVWGHPAAPTWG